MVMNIKVPQSHDVLYNIQQALLMLRVAHDIAIYHVKGEKVDSVSYYYHLFFFQT